MNSTLDTALLAHMIKTKRGNTGLRELAQQIGEISAPTLSRMEQGKLPDVETFIRVCDWLGVSTDTFVVGEKKNVSNLSAKDQILFQLRSTRELDEETISAMITMVDMAFKKAKKKNAR